MLFSRPGQVCVLHFYPEIFYVITALSTFASKVKYSGTKYIYIERERYYYWAKCAEVGFSG